MKRSLENMNIAIIHEWLTNVAGSEKVLLELIKNFPTAKIYSSVFDPSKAALFSQFDIKTTYLQKMPLVKKHRELLVPLTPLAFEQLDLSGFDLIISNSTMAAKGVITKPDAIHISYCNTPPRYLWEPSVDPRAKSGHFAWLRRNVIHNLRIWDQIAAKRVDYFLANSNYIAARIKKYYQRDAEVVYPPVNLTDFKLNSEIKKTDNYLFVSRLVNYKKCDLVIQTFNKLKLPLTIIGTGPDERKLRQMAKDNIKFLGHVSGEKLISQYQQAKALVFPAEEDFGIVPVEAMACGTPVIAFNRGGATETIVENETGLFFETQSVDSLEEAINKMAKMQFDPQKLRSQAEKFSEENFAKNIKSAIDKILSLEN